MGITVLDSGSDNTNGSTPVTLVTDTSGKTSILALDLGALVGGATPDILEVSIKTKVLSTSDLELNQFATFVGGLLVTKVKYSLPIPANHTIECSMKLPQGTNRAIEWALLALD